MAMNDAQAAARADTIIENIIKSQPNFWPSWTFQTDEHPKVLAKRLAAFRQTLIEELKQQA